MFEANIVYTFSTLAPALLGSQIKNARCLIAGMTAQVARGFEAIDQLYAKIASALPEGSVIDVNAQIYYLFEGESGEKKVIAGQWVDPGTITTIVTNAYSVYIPAASPADIERARLALKAAQISNFQITQVA